MASCQEKGFTLIEILIGTVVMGVMMAIVFTFLTRGVGRWHRIEESTERQQMARMAFERIQREIRHIETGASANEATNCVACHSLLGAAEDGETTPYHGFKTIDRYIEELTLSGKGDTLVFRGDYDRWEEEGTSERRRFYINERQELIEEVNYDLVDPPEILAPLVIGIDSIRFRLVGTYKGEPDTFQSLPPGGPENRCVRCHASFVNDLSPKGEHPENFWVEGVGGTFWMREVKGMKDLSLSGFTRIRSLDYTVRR